ncbi:MAG: hypothetical protein COA73_14960 [Candidatus Hydrogenedentota bacterium]|nr:MAG: hypothetical protein COA73_14960 [Candidatus Hydrogenedentota bacterium]
MDLSKVKWVVIVLVVVGGGWLVTEGGMDYVFNAATEELPGNDPEKDVIDEASLSKYGGFLLSTFRYTKAKIFYTAAIERYGPEGGNYYWNIYQLARCEEKMGNYESAVLLLRELHNVDGDAFDERVPGRDTLKLRIMKLVETHDLSHLAVP